LYNYANHSFIDQTEWAIKIIRKDKGYTQELSTALIELEAATMINLGSHPWLVNLIEANKSYWYYKKSENPSKSTAEAKQLTTAREEIDYMAIEKCEHGSLSKYIKYTGGLEEELCRFMFTQLCSAVHFMHSQEYVHLDLKLDNILLDEFYNVKLADLGIALNAKGTSKYIWHVRGTKKYMAPEVENVSKKAPFQVFRADIYSLGICLHLMLLGCYPNEYDCDVKFRANNLDSECVDLIESMLSPFPVKRPTIEQIFEHPWMWKSFEQDIAETVFMEMNERNEYLTQVYHNDSAELSLDLE